MAKGVNIRDQALIARLDLVVARLRAEFPGRRVSREGVTRELLYEALGTVAFRMATTASPAPDAAVPPPAR